MSNNDLGVSGKKIDELQYANRKNGSYPSSDLILTVDFPIIIGIDVNSKFDRGVLRSS
jgi:hypothetical protein